MKRLIFGFLLIAASIHGDAQYSSYTQRLNEEYTSGLFRSFNAHLIDAANDPSASSYRNAFQYLTGKLPGLTIVDNGNYRTFVSYRNWYPAFFLDEMPVDASAVASVNMNDVAIIKVFRPPFIGARGANGAIAVYTKTGCEEEEDDDARK